MTDDPTRSPSALTRRAALAGLGAGAAGMALTATQGHASTHDLLADAALHPVVGLWQNAVSGTGGLPWTFSVYHADGTYHEWNGLKLGSALGIWRPTGERTAELMFIYQDTDPSATYEVPGTVTFRMTIEADESGDALTATGDLDLRTAGGRHIAEPGVRWTSERMTFDWNPATGSTAPAGPSATPTD